MKDQDVLRFIEQLTERLMTTKYRISQKKETRVTVAPDSPMHSLTTLTDAQANEIDKWVKEVGIGRRISWDTWALKDSKSVSMFMLRWS